VISLVSLNGVNYGNWSRLVINAIKSKNKLGFANGDLEKPTNDVPKAQYM